MTNDIGAAMPALLLWADKHNTAFLCWAARIKCRNRLCRRVRKCQSIERHGAPLTCIDDPESCAKLDKDRRIILDIIQGRHMIIRQPTDGERWLEKHGIWFARALLRRESRQRHLFEAWLRDYRVQEARRKAGEFDKPVDTQAILAEARAELAETEAMLKKFNID